MSNAYPNTVPVLVWTTLSLGVVCMVVAICALLNDFGQAVGGENSPGKPALNHLVTSVRV